MPLVLLTSVCLAAGILAPFTPARGHAWTSQVLRGWSRRSRLVFAFDADGLLVEGAEVARALVAMVVRPVQAGLLFVGFSAASDLLLVQGPPLSQSGAASIGVAALEIAAVLAPAWVLREFLGPYRSSLATDEGEAARPADIEDYLAPFVRVLLWVGATAAGVIALGAVVVAAGPSYDAGLVWWEGLVGFPVVVVALVLWVERSLSGLVDHPGPEADVQFVWDRLRSQSARLLVAVVLASAARLCRSAAGGLTGVARSPDAGGWTDAVSGGCVVAMALLAIGAVVALVLPRRPRFWWRLWPEVERGGLVLFGAAKDRRV